MLEKLAINEVCAAALIMAIPKKGPIQGVQIKPKQAPINKPINKSFLDKSE